MSRETGSRARARRRAERRLPHFRTLALAAADTKALAQEMGVERLGELETNPFEEAARQVLEERSRGRLTDADLDALGVRELDGALWIKVGRAWGRG